MRRRRAGTPARMRVAHLQEELADLGYYEGPHDGDFSEETEAALRQLQADEGIETTGKLDRATLAVLGALAGNSDALSVKAVQTALAGARPLRRADRRGLRAGDGGGDRGGAAGGGHRGRRRVRA